MSLLSVGIMSSFLGLETNLVAFVLTGAITAGVLQVTQLDVSYGLLYDIWGKSIKHSFLAPVENSDYLIGSWIIGIIRGTVVFGLLSYFSSRIFGFSLPGIYETFIFLCGLFLSALNVGMFVWLLIFMFGQKVDITAWTMAHMLMLLSGIYYPVSYLPGFLKPLASLIPLTYFLEYYRSFYGFETVYSNLIIKGFSLTVVYTIVLYYLLSIALKKAKRSGILLKLSE